MFLTVSESVRLVVTVTVSVALTRPVSRDETSRLRMPTGPRCTANPCNAATSSRSCTAVSAGMLRLGVTRSGGNVTVEPVATCEYTGRLVGRVSGAERREELVALNETVEGRVGGRKQ